jgi:hypothetical protein
MGKEPAMDTSIPPGEFKVEYLTGEVALKAREVSMLTGIHPVVVEMAKKLIEKPGSVGRFLLGTDELKANADAIEQEFMKGLRKVARAVAAKDRLGPKNGRDGHALVFWMQEKKEWLGAKKKAGKVT